MRCGGTKIKRPDNGDKLLSEMRDYLGMELNIKLGDYKIEFRPDIGEWKTNLNEKPIVEDFSEVKKTEIQKLKEESQNLSNELAGLEKEYLAKIAKLLIMAQVHCEVKSEINYIFDELGISHVVEEKEHVEVIGKNK